MLFRSDPLAAAEAFGKVDGVRLEIVGFNINRPEWLEQLKAMAARAHARYLPAEQAEDLLRELKSAVFQTPESFELVDPSGKVTTGNFGQSFQLPEGKYRLRTSFAGENYAEELWINAGRITAVNFDAANAAALKAPAAAADAAPSSEPPPANAPPAAAKRFCTQCGAELKPGAKFCTNCGAKVGS